MKRPLKLKHRRTKHELIKRKLKIMQREIDSPNRAIKAPFSMEELIQMVRNSIFGWPKKAKS